MMSFFPTGLAAASRIYSPRLFSAAPALRQHHAPLNLRSERFLSTAENDDSPSSMTDAESAIASTLSSYSGLQPTTSVLVRDVSGGCGSMYAIDIASPRFEGMNLLAQQRLVNKALGERVKEWHGLQIRTRVSSAE